MPTAGLAGRALAAAAGGAFKIGQAGMLQWFGGFASAFSIKLSSSIDDVVWLAPFLTSNATAAQRLRNAMIYVSVCLIQTVVAMVIAISGNQVVSYITAGAKDAWSPEKILTVLAGCMLAFYSLKLGHEYIQEMREADTEEDTGEENKYNKVATEEGEAADAEAGGAPVKTGSKGSLSARNRTIEHAETQEDEKAKESKESSQSQTLFVIAFIGSVDDLTLFVPMLVGKGFDIVQLVSGGFFAATLIVMICVFLGLCKPIADCLSKIPLALIVVVFATVLLSRAVFMK